MRVSCSYLPLSDFNPLPGGGFYIGLGKIKSGLRSVGKDVE